MSVETLRVRGVAVAGIGYSEYAGGTPAERTNPSVIFDMTGVSVETLPPLLSLDKPGDAVTGVGKHLLNLGSTTRHNTPPGVMQRRKQLNTFSHSLRLQSNTTT